MQTLTNQVLTAHTSERGAVDAARAIAQRFEGFEATVVLFFASSRYDHEALNQAMREQFPQAALIGCTTAGELAGGLMLKDSLVAMAFDGRTIEDVDVQVVTDLRGACDVKSALQGFERHFGLPVAEMAFDRYVGMVLVDGLSVAEERVMDRLGDLTNLTFIGGSTGDDLQFKVTYVYANGRAYTDAAVLALFKPARGFEILKTQSFVATEHTLVVTDADEVNRVVRAFNGRPAVEAYAEAVGKPVSEAADAFMHNPLGLIANGEIFVRSPQQLQGDAMVFYCNVVEGMELRVLEGQDIVEDTRAALEAKLAETGPIAALINFHCILRTLELEQNGQCEAYGQLFEQLPSVGFSTYGEQYIGHINQTSTMLILR